jgi:cobaltochelatase CobN
VKWGGFVYGKDKQGRAAPEQFRANLARIEVVVRNQDSREYDMFDSDDFYAYQGGMIASVTALKGDSPTNYFGDTSDPERPAVRRLESEAKRILRTRVLNPKWIKSMRSYGYRGATEFTQIVDTAFGWDATSHVLDDWSYEQITDSYVLDDEMQKWFAEVNPYALQNITRRLLEAIDRELWEADDEMRQQLRQVYLSMEGVIEEAM